MGALITFVRAFGDPGLRRRLLLTLGAVALFRIGQLLPLPGVDPTALKAAVATTAGQDQLYGAVDLFTGGGLLRLSVFLFGVLPLFAARFLMELLGLLVPRLAALLREGSAGRTVVARLTRLLTVCLSALLAVAVVFLAADGHVTVLHDTSVLTLVSMAACATAGSALVLRLAELITARGIGDGVQVLFLAQLVAVFPGQLWSVREARGGPGATAVLILVLVLGVAVSAALIATRTAQRPVPVQYAKRMIGRRAFGGTASYIPLRVNPVAVTTLVGVLALPYLPLLAARLWPGADWLRVVAPYVQQSSPWCLAVSFVLVVLWVYVCAMIEFDDEAVADNLKRYGAFVPGIRAGLPTAEYLGYVRARVALSGALSAGLIALTPATVLALFGVADRYAFGGPSILLVAGIGTGIAFDIIREVQSENSREAYAAMLR
ncbi:preprotein translocase subunit SecY [Kitasatospora sp. McL0602]|uniref:preprotein translocase subunit SecY n=1 Tax=Kitasatospora sp. McL0602 TaxID=3439530 RepID=UPI003F8B6B25